jgi:hypothetical protein
MANIESGEGGTPREAGASDAFAFPPMDESGTDDAVLGDEDWPAATAKRGVRLRTPTAVLIGLVLLAGGFWGGAILQKDEGSSGSGGFASLRSEFSRGATSRTGGSSLFGSGGATTGTVTDVIGKALYITSSSGSLVKVTLGPSATVTRNATSSLADLKIGDTVIVEGVKTKSGAVTASSISATAAGVTSSFASVLGGG